MVWTLCPAHARQMLYHSATLPPSCFYHYSAVAFIVSKVTTTVRTRCSSQMGKWVGVIIKGGVDCYQFSGGRKVSCMMLTWTLCFKITINIRQILSSKAPKMFRCARNSQSSLFYLDHFLLGAVMKVRDSDCPTEMLPYVNILTCLGDFSNFLKFSLKPVLQWVWITSMFNVLKQLNHIQFRTSSQVLWSNTGCLKKDFWN